MCVCVCACALQQHIESNFFSTAVLDDSTVVFSFGSSTESEFIICGPRAGPVLLVDVIYVPYFELNSSFN